ncbi:MAG TPA: hypothetical protein VGL42_12630 [Opitutaceae bacterium]|jgi:hypothetical protein
MSNTISNTNGTLSGALLNLGTNPQASSSGSAASTESGIEDTLQLSSPSIAEIEQQAAEVAQQNQNSVISSSDEALVVNLQAVSSLGQSFSQAAASQGALNGGSVLSLTQ